MGRAWNGRVSEAGTADLEEGEERVRGGRRTGLRGPIEPDGVGIDPCLLPSVLPPTSYLFPYGFCFFVISATQNQPSLSGGLCLLTLLHQPLLLTSTCCKNSQQLHGHHFPGTVSLPSTMTLTVWSPFPR